MKPAIFDRRQLENTNYAIQSWVKFKSIRSHKILFSGSAILPFDILNFGSAWMFSHSSIG